MLDHISDKEEAEPVLMLARLLGKLRVAGMQTRTISYAQALMNKNINEGRHYCIRLAVLASSLNIEYVVMVPWRDRDARFENFYE